MNRYYFNTESGRIAYQDDGSGPLVVCVPSMGDLRQEYRFITPLLVQAGYRVVVMDVRGHGESSVDWADFSVAGIGRDILALINHLASGPAIIIGESMAAGAAVYAAAEGPDQVKGMILVGPFVRGGGGFLNNLMMSVMFGHPWGPAAWRKYYSMLYPTRKPADFNEYLGTLQTNLSEPGRMNSLIKMLHASKSASEARLPRVSAPALVIMGSKDPDFPNPAAEASWVAQSLRAEHRMLPGAGHYPHAEFPTETFDLMIPFLESLR